jgi:uncharacterized protein
VDLPSYVSSTGDATVVETFGQPRSAKDSIVGVQGAALKIKVKAAPVEGKANDAVIALLARGLGVATARLHVVSGRSSRHKRIRVDGLTPEAVAGALALVLSSHAHDGG